MTFCSRLPVFFFILALCFSKVAYSDNILVLGDSIAEGYFPHLQSLLPNMNFDRNLAPNRDGILVQDIPWEGTNFIVKVNKFVDLSGWMKHNNGPVDVVYFNFGMHEFRQVEGQRNVSETEYRDNLASIVNYMRSVEPNAKYIFGLTTPVPANSPGRIAGDEIIYNNIAKQVMSNLGVYVDDLHTVMAQHPEYSASPGNVHFTTAGSRYLASHVAQTIQGVVAVPEPGSMLALVVGCVACIVRLRKTRV